MKQFLRYTLTLVAILMVTTNAWAAATCHTVTKSTFTTDASYQSGSLIKRTYYYYSPSDQSSFTISNDLNTISQVSFDATGDTEDGDLKFKVIYKTANNSSWQEIGNEITLARYLDWGYKAETETITLKTSSYPELAKATEIGLRFTKYNNNSSGYQSKKRTIIISNVSVTFSPYFQSDANNTTLEAFPPTEKGTICGTTRSFTYKYNNTVTSVNWESSNPMFTVSSTRTDDCSGEKVVTITFKPTEIRSEITSTITGTDNNGNKIVVYVKGSSWGKEDPTYTWKPEIWNGTSQARTIYVGETINDMLSYTSSPANCTYTIEKLQDYGINNGDAITTFTNNTLVAGRAGRYKLTVSQPAHSISGTSGYNAGETTITLDVVKNTSYFTLNFADEYFVDDQIAKSTFLVSPTNTEVAISVTDNKGYFSDTNDNFIANCPTPLPADNDQTTITVTQPENYKWTSYSLSKTVTVKKRPSDFSWQLTDTYYVDDVITSIFSKAANNLPTTITSSDPNILKVDGNQLIAINAGEVTITAKQDVDRKWVAFTQTKKVTILKHDIVATINPNTAYWNELVSNPFSATSTHPVSGQVTPIDQFNVEQQNNEHIALMDANTRDIQTYYTNGTVDFLITRDADRKYNALSQTLTLTVNANWGCNLIENQSASANYSLGNTGETYSTEFSLNNGIGTTLMFNYKLTEGASYNHYLTPQYSLTENGDNFDDIPNSTQTTQSTTPNSVTITLPDGTKRIRFKRTSEWLGTKSFSISNITVTRAQYIRPTDAEGALSGTNPLNLPTVAKGIASSASFNFAWSACSDIKIVCDNPKFTIATPDIYSNDGEQSISVSCNTTETGTFTGTITIYNQENETHFPVSCEVYNKWLTDSITGSTNYSIKVDGTWETDFYFPIERASEFPTTDGDFHYSIEHTFDDNAENRNPNHPDEVISYTNGVITAHNAGTAVLTIKHEDTDEHFASQPFTCTITVTKHNSEFNLKLEEHTCKIDAVIPEATFFSKATQNNIDATIDIEILNIADAEHPEVLTFNANTRKFTATSAGRATVTISQPVHYKWTEYTGTIDVEVKKHTPIFTWKDPVYFNQTITDYFSTDNNNTEITITQSSTDEDVAILYFDSNNESDLHTLDLTTYYKETTPLSSTQVTVYQAENWYWNAKEDTHTIKPKNKNNHVSNTPITKTNLSDFKIEYQDPWNNPWTNDGIHFGEPNIGDGGGGWNWNDKYIIIEFTGVPDSLFFTTATTGSAGMDNPLDAGDNATNNKFFYVSAGTSKDNLREIWSSTSQTNTYKEKLDPSVRFLKLCYTGNLEGWFKNVRITELNQFEFIPDALDFGEVKITDNTSKTLTTKFHYANAGHNIKVELDRSSFADEAAYELAKQYITINPTSITDIGGEKVGKTEIQITLHSDDRTPYTIPDGAKIKIWDEAGRCDYLSISGLIEPSEQEIYWSAYFQLAEPIAIPLETGDIKNAATASSKLPITYETDNPTVIQISEDKSYFTPIAVGNATITAIQEGNEVYGRVTSSKSVTVTPKMVQIISWPIDLTDLILREENEPIALDAKAYLLDIVNDKVIFDQDQTDKIVYHIEDEDVVTIVDGQLIIVGLGATTITASITEAEDSHYESTFVTLPVKVRKPAVGCEDILLLNQPTEVEIFTENYNTNEIVMTSMAIDRNLGIPGRVEFQHKGEVWRIFGSLGSFYAGSIKVQQSTDGGNNWSDVPGSEVTPTVSVYNTTIATLSRNATHIRFVRPSGGEGYHYYKDVKVYPAQYMESTNNTVNYENINIGGTYKKQITISYSNIKSPVTYIASSSDITVSPSNFGECGTFGTQELTIIWKPSNNAGQQTVTFCDTLSNIPDLTINLTANIDRRKQEIIWENRPEAILSHTGIDNRPTYTVDANSKESTSLKINYEVVEGTENAYFADDLFFILNEGTIKIKASNDGNEEYAAVEEFYDLILQGVPPTFIGGAEDQFWNNENNWKNNLMPSEEHSTANITAPVVINEHISVGNVRVSDEATIHITSTGGLTVGVEGIQCANNDGSAIIIDNLHSGAGFFRISPDCEDELPRITMRYQTKSTLDLGANKDATWQYIGAPGEDASVHVDYNTWLYRLDESQADWVLMPQLNNHTLSPFQGYALTQYGQPTYEWNAQMINRNCTIPLTYHFDGRKGQNLIANSYTAPIDVTRMLPKDFQMIEGQSEYYDITQTLYLYNSGSWNAWHTQDSLGTGITSDGNNTTPGQYYAIPVLAVAEGYIPERPTIAPMQGIYVRVRAKKTGGDTHVGNIIFDYDRIVMGEGHDMHRPMRAPKKSDIASIPSENFRRLRIVATSEHSGADRLYIIQDDINTRNYDNGYDAPNQATQGIVNIYTYESGGKMEVSCANNIDSTYIGFMAGEDRTYTLHFNAIIGETLYLQDLVSGEKIYIVEDGTYTFEAEPQSTNNKRFLLHAKRAINSDMEDVNAAHIWFSNHTLYVTNATDNSLLQLYDVSGHMIFSSTIHRTPYTVDLTHLTEGVYMARVNNQVYKFVCK